MNNKLERLLLPNKAYLIFTQALLRLLKLILLSYFFQAKMGKLGNSAVKKIRYILPKRFV